MDNRDQEEGSQMEHSVREALLRNWKTNEQGQNNWNAF
jgi:hypothetical protein